MSLWFLILRAGQSCSSTGAEMQTSGMEARASSESVSVVFRLCETPVDREVVVAFSKDMLMIS